MSFFSHPNLLQSPHQSFILPSYFEASVIALANLCSPPPSLEPRTYYHVGVETFINDEAIKIIRHFQTFVGFDCIALVLNGVTSFHFYFSY